MNNNSFFIFLGVVLITITVMPSCKKNVEVGPPVNKLVTTNVFSNDNTATAAQFSVYIQMANYPWIHHRVTGMSSDEFINYATDQTSKYLYINSLNAIADGGAINIWSLLYNYIYQENAVLEGLNNSTGVSSRVKQQLKGEAEFIRSYYFFNLVTLYGDIPLTTSTDYKLNSAMKRAPADQVFQKIIEDLRDAQSILSAKYLDATDTAISADRIRPTSWVAAALLAKAYLYLGKYDSSEAEATLVINNTSLFNLPTDLSKIFSKNSSETIWQITPLSTDSWTAEGDNFCLITSPGSGLSNSTSLSVPLLNAFELGDQRKIYWINSYTKGSTTWYYPYKYKDNHLSATSLKEYTMMFRLAEQYLIRAEARAQLGNSSGAIADLNVIRARAGLSGYIGATDKNSILAAILHEREVELFTEGHRWLDLKRAGNIDAVMGTPGGACAAKGGTWSTNQQLYPIPIGDIQNDGNLIQNVGY